eukprot:363740-Chlamydomonas_euryale.AAC.31
MHATTCRNRVPGQDARAPTLRDTTKARVCRPASHSQRALESCTGQLVQPGAASGVAPDMGPHIWTHAGKSHAGTSQLPPCLTACVVEQLAARRFPSPCTEWDHLQLPVPLTTALDLCPLSIIFSAHQYEAVHPIANWDDLKRRLHPADRRVYAFMHACMPTEPLVILHTALTCRPATALRELLPSYASGGCATRTATPCPGGSSSSSSSSSTRQGLEGGVEDTEQPAVAVFYSISSTQPGLSGVDLGHFLIKKAAELVKVSVPGRHRIACLSSSMTQSAHAWGAEFPSVNLLVTLSPLPNFRRWLTARLKYEIEVNKSNGNASHSEERAAASTGMTSARARQRPPKWLLSEEDACGLLDAAALLPSSSLHKLNQALGGELPESPIDQGQRCRLLAAWLSTDLWHAPEQESGVDSTFRRLLLRLAARFLVCERRRNLCLDPVANFHLRNGAQLFKLHWAADCSDRGLSNSFGIMVSYRYDTELVHARNHQYLVDRTVAVADDVAKLLHEPQE